MDSLKTYLRDHHSGALGALELLGHLIDHARDASFRSFCLQLRDEISSDVEELKGIMKRNGAPESAVGKLAGWLGGKATEIKLLLEGEDRMELGRLQALEALCLGITGKKALWTALRELGDANAVASAAELERLLRRAEEQWQRVESERLKTAGCALRKS